MFGAFSIPSFNEDHFISWSVYQKCHSDERWVHLVDCVNFWWENSRRALVGEVLGQGRRNSDTRRLDFMSSSVMA
jgi:hypothetical protein